jgi:hypothetical protein
MADRSVPASLGDLYVTAARANHLAVCADCREIDDEVNALAAANATSIARRDRRQLALRLTNTTAVTA